MHHLRRLSFAHELINVVLLWLQIIKDLLALLVLGWDMPRGKKLVRGRGRRAVVLLMMTGLLDVRRAESGPDELLGVGVLLEKEVAVVLAQPPVVVRGRQRLRRDWRVP